VALAGEVPRRALLQAFAEAAVPVALPRVHLLPLLPERAETLPPDEVDEAEDSQRSCRRIAAWSLF